MATGCTRVAASRERHSGWKPESRDATAAPAQTAAGGRGAATKWRPRSRRWGEPRVPNPPVPSRSPDPTAPDHCAHPGTAPTTPRAKVSAHYSRGSDSETKRQGGAHDPSVKTTLPRTALPPSGPLTQYPKGDVPQRPPRINCAHWTPSSAQRAALTTRDLSGHEEASIREAFPSK
ncbi:unnamed protein product [Rangifer tarandus platyrhynchus]|uniref:Uncharacterized protein n=2 Tax=Rangifer tarandus platyrhynchus TaxID=3082113 RepID=A0ABN8ZX71_RANTA|nr:unnamed protein product [Rangifer tarandus platyrhynchus]CAI9710281.1 unnamed protein product [Rangifer tarandus platyrhynchus]